MARGLKVWIYEVEGLNYLTKALISCTVTADQSVRKLRIITVVIICQRQNKYAFHTKKLHTFAKWNEWLIQSPKSQGSIPKTTIIQIPLVSSKICSAYRKDPKFRTGWSGQIVQTQIRLLLEQSDQSLHYLQYCLHLLDALFFGKPSFFQF